MRRSWPGAVFVSVTIFITSGIASWSVRSVRPADDIVESRGEDPFDIEDDEDDGESDPLSDINHVKHLRDMADLLNKVADALTVPDAPE